MRSPAKFHFIDLFAGIGGLRLPFEALGGRCVFTSEWNLFSQQTYRKNFPQADETPQGDIAKIPTHDIPDHDLLLAGFPCQPFSIAGVSKKLSLGREHGFADKTQGALFFEVARIIHAKKPKCFLLENVKNLHSHDKGRTFQVIKDTLAKDLGYKITHKVIDGKPYTSQHRERIYIVGFREAHDFSFEKMQLPPRIPKLNSILHKTDGTEPVLPWDGDRFFEQTQQAVNPKFTLSPKLWAYLQNYAEKHKAAGNGFGYGLITKESPCTRTLSARYYKDGSEILVAQKAGECPRRLTPRECARLMGFPDTFQIPVSNTQAYKQFGNSVVVPVIREIARLLIPYLASSESAAHNEAWPPKTLNLTASPSSHPPR